MDINELYKWVQKMYNQYDINLENYSDICNPNKSEIFDTVKNKKYDESYRLIYNSTQQGGYSLFRTILCFWTRDIEKLETLSRLLVLQFINEWNVERGTELSGLKPTRNAFRIEHDREYVIQLMQFNRRLKSVKTNSIKQLQLKIND